MIHCIHRAKFVSARDDVHGKRIAGYVFSLPGGDTYLYTHTILAIWTDDGELFVEDKAGCTYQIVDFDYDDSARQIGSMREEIFRGFFR